MKYIAAIIRKSPTKDADEEISIQRHRDQLLKAIRTRHKAENITIHWFIDVCSGDDEKGRVMLKRFFKTIGKYDEAWCPNVDRWARSWLGLKWLHEHILPSKCKLYFLDGTKLYDDNGEIEPLRYVHFAIVCIFAYYELIMIRQRTKKGRERVLNDPKLRKQKYKGRPKGAKDLKPREKEGYYR